MQGAFGFNIEITMMLKEVKITITVSSEFAEYIKQLVAPHVRPKTAIPLPKPPISQAEWLLKTPEGKQFAQDCMKFKYSRLSHKQLIQLATKLYYKTYGIDPTNKARQYIPEMTAAYIQNKMLVKALTEGLNFRPKPTLVINNE